MTSLFCHGQKLNHIKLNEANNRYYFVEYSDEYSDGRYSDVGEPINFCPYCGRDLK